jgi:hypothetical protein
LSSFKCKKIVAKIHIDPQVQNSYILIDLFGVGLPKKSSGHRFVDTLSLLNGTNKYTHEAKICFEYLGVSTFQENEYAELGRYYEPAITELMANGELYETFTIENTPMGDFVPNSEHETGLPDFILTNKNILGEIKTLGIITKD